MKLRTEVRDDVFIVTINRPEVRNCVDRETAEALAEAFGGFDADDSLKVAVLTVISVRGQISRRRALGARTPTR
jgi:enoyl-CoA hydratase/carnithine racemase